MSEHLPYLADGLSVTEIAQLRGPAVIDFGTNWCEHCQEAQPIVSTVLGRHPHIQHLKFEDGKGRPQGRAFKVKLWPTLIFLRDGAEVARVVRPRDSNEIEQALQSISA